jgi:lipopolysaccharide/colanic/teichoic acid biosynthesis glycosyltransferase
MRLVGPRPETPEFVARYDASELRVLDVKPGFVGPSTLAFMDEAERLAESDDPAAYYERVLLHERVQADLRYLEERSAAYDMRLLARQAAAILLRR